MSFNLYTFGCSFTNYIWPTWADILGKYADEYKNFAKSGVGNYFIFHELIQFISNHEIKENDIIVICWSNFCREDRIKNKNWISLGPTTIEKYGEDFINNFFDLDHYIERDRTFIIASIELLKSKKINFLMFSYYDIFSLEAENKNFIESISGSLSKFFKIYKDDVKKDNFYKKYSSVFLPSLSSHLKIKLNYRPLTIFESDSNPILDIHPTPAEHLKYVEDILIPKYFNSVKVTEEHKKELHNITKEIFKNINIYYKK